MGRGVSREQLASILRPVASAVLSPADAQRQHRLNSAIDDDGTINPRALGIAAPRHLIDWYLAGTATVANNQSAEVRAPRAGVLEWLDVRAKTAPTGAALIAQLRIDGNAVATASIAAAATSGGEPLEIGIAAGSVLTVDITQVGSGTAGADVTVTVSYREQVN
jgi:hypothetical protein